jgi:hypothetical protein
MEMNGSFCVPASLFPQKEPGIGSRASLEVAAKRKTQVFQPIASHFTES